MPTFAASLRDIREAAGRISGRVHRTPVMQSSYLESLAGRPLYFKCELFQRTGSFKFRGACNAVMSLTDQQAKCGVVTHSSGNHAQALALAAHLRGIPAHVVMPHDSARSKIAAVESYHGKVYFCEPTVAARSAKANEVQRATGATLIPPYDHPQVIAGQGTIALEMLEDFPQLEAIVVPLGGGGMISGIALAARELKPGIKIIGAEPREVGDAAESKRLGVRQEATGRATIADGLRTSMGDLTWPVVRDLVDSVATVSEDEIRCALRLVYERMKLAIEPSAAVGIAAALGPLRERTDFNSVGVIFCGGNTDLDQLASLLSPTAKK